MRPPFRGLGIALALGPIAAFGFQAVHPSYKARWVRRELLAVKAGAQSGSAWIRKKTQVRYDKLLKLATPEAIQEIATSDPDAMVRGAAIVYLAGPEAKEMGPDFFTGIAAHDGAAYVRRAAIGTLDDAIKAGMTVDPDKLAAGLRLVIRGGSVSGLDSEIVNLLAGSHGHDSVMALATISTGAFGRDARLQAIKALSKLHTPEADATFADVLKAWRDDADAAQSFYPVESKP